MISSIQQQVVGKPLDRIDGPQKVTGTAAYAFEHSLDDVTYAFPVQSTIAKGRIVSVDASGGKRPVACCVMRAFREKVKKTVGRGRACLEIWPELCIATVIKRTEKNESLRSHAR